MKNQLFFPFVETKERKLDALRKGIIPAEYQGDLTVYLLHFPPMGGESHKISHYLGSCRELKTRLRQHLRGKGGAKITAALKERGVKPECVMTWRGVNRQFEKYLKSWRNHKHFCPYCSGDLPFFS